MDSPGALKKGVHLGQIYLSACSCWQEQLTLLEAFLVVLIATDLLETWLFGMPSQTNGGLFGQFSLKTLIFSKNLGQYFSHITLSLDTLRFPLTLQILLTHLSLSFHFSENSKFKFYFCYYQKYCQCFLLQLVHCFSFFCLQIIGITTANTTLFNYNGKI